MPINKDSITDRIAVIFGKVLLSPLQTIFGGLAFVLALLKGVFIFLGVLLSIIIITISVLINRSVTEDKIVLDDNTILEIKSATKIADVPKYYALQRNIFNEGTMPLKVVLEAIKKAGSDDKISAILLNFSELEAGGLVNYDLMRQALIEFKKSGKPIVAFSPVYSMQHYYLASLADKVYLNPGGIMMLNGFGAIRPYYKSLLDKIGVNFEVFKNKEYKSAADSYIRDDMSKYERKSYSAIINSVMQSFVQNVAKGRDIDVHKLRTIIDDGFMNQKSALSNGMVDGIATKFQMIEKIDALITKESEGKNSNEDLDEKYTMLPLRQYVKGDLVAEIKKMLSSSVAAIKNVKNKLKSQRQKIR